MATATEETEASSLSVWRPSFWGRLFFGGGSWSLQVQPESLSVEVQGLDRSTDPVVVPAGAVAVHPGRFWSTVVLEVPDGSEELSGLPGIRARALQATLDHCRHLDRLRRAFEEGLTEVAAWSGDLEQEMGRWKHRWWPRELVGSWHHGRPAVDGRFRQARAEGDLQAYVRGQPRHVHRALEWLDMDLADHAARRNNQFLRRRRGLLRHSGVLAADRRAGPGGGVLRQSCASGRCGRFG